MKTLFQCFEKIYKPRVTSFVVKVIPVRFTEVVDCDSSLECESISHLVCPCYLWTKVGEILQHLLGSTITLKHLLIKESFEISFKTMPKTQLF